jgi:tetratricopeptide (TPR) repeat protein
MPALVVLAAGTTVTYHLTQQEDISYFKGHRLFVRGQYRQAIPLFQKTLSLNPRRLDALREIACVYQWTGANKKAIEYFTKILAVTPADAKMQFALAEALSWDKQYDAAIALYEKIIAATGDVRAKEHLAYVYLWSKRFDLAKSEAEEILRKDPENISAKLIVAKGLSYTGEAPKAIALYEQILKEEEAPQKEVKDLQEKKTDKQAAVQQAAARQEVRELLSEAYMVDKQYEKAVSGYQAVLKADPGNVKARVGIADILGWEKKYDEAIVEYKKALEADPGNLDIMEKLAQVYMWKSDFRAAVTAYREILKIDPDRLSAVVSLGEILTWQKEYPDAIGLLETALGKKRDERTLMLYAEALQYAKEYPKAIAIYTEVLAMDPANAAARRRIAEVYLWAGDFKNAREVIQIYLHDNPRDFKALVLQAKLHHFSGEPARAIAIYEEALQGGRIKMAEDELAQMEGLLADAYMVNKEYDKAVRYYTAVIEKDPKNIKARTGLIDVLTWQNTYDDALNACADALELFPKNRDIEQRLAELYIFTGKFAQSKEILERIIQAHPNDTKAQFLLAKAKHFSGDMQGALQIYEELLKEGGVGSRKELGGLISEAYKNTGRYDDAVRWYREMLKEDPRNVRARESLAEVLSWTGKQDEAIAAYEQVLKNDPANNEVKIKLGQLYSWRKEYARAENLFRAALQSDPKNTEAYGLLGETLLWNKKYDEARRWITKGLALKDTQHLRVLEGQVYLYKGDYAKAKEILKKVVDADPKNVKARMYYADAFAYGKDFKKAIELYRAILKDGKKTDNAPLSGAVGGPTSWNYFQKGEEAFRCLAPQSELGEVLSESSASGRPCVTEGMLVPPPVPQEDDTRLIKEKLADVLSWDKQYKESVALYDELIKEKEDPKLRLQKARVLGWAREYTKALDEYRRLYGMFHDPKVKLEMEGKEYYWEGRVERAIRTYSRLIQEDPENVEAMFDLSQIYSYQAMWHDAKGEYQKILAIAPAHFRAKDGYAKARLISQHAAVRTQYEFYEADSSSRSDDIRRNHFFNELLYPVNDRLSVIAGHKIGWRQFSDYPNLIENEGRVRLSYINNPQWAVTGFYDLIHYTQNVPNMHTFGEALTLRTFDIGQFRFSHERQRLENNSTVIRQNYFSDNFTERWQVDVTKRLKLGAEYLFGNYSDCNYKHEPGADITYFISLDPKRLAVTYRYFYRNFDETVYEYWSPKGYNNNLWSVNWRHFLNREEIFFGAHDIYYDFRYDVSLDSQGVVSHRFEAGFHWDISNRLNVNVKAATTNTSANVYTDKGVTAEVKYYF